MIEFLQICKKKEINILVPAISTLLVENHFAITWYHIPHPTIKEFIRIIAFSSLILSWKFTTNELHRFPN